MCGIGGQDGQVNSAFKAAPETNHDFFGGGCEPAESGPGTWRAVFDTNVLSGSPTYLAGHTGGDCQILQHPWSHGRAEPDLPVALTDISLWIRISD
jgi:hypothetical protein